MRVLRYNVHTVLYDTYSTVRVGGSVDAGGRMGWMDMGRKVDRNTVERRDGELVLCCMYILRMDLH